MNIFSHSAAIAIVAGLSILSFPGSTAALEFTRNDDIPAGCTTLASGTIEPGDRDKLRAILPGGPGAAPYTEDTPRLCLDSPGGNFREGLAIAQYLVRAGIATHVAADHRCISACAIAFLGGTSAGFEDAIVRRLDRSLNTLGTLGFHAPRLDVPEGQFTRTQVIRAFDVAMRASGEIFANLDALQISRDFALEVFAVPTGEILYVDTVSRTIDVGLRVEGLKPLPAEMAEDQLREICERIDPEMRPDYFDQPESTRAFQAVQGMTLSPAPTGARRGAWLTGYWAEGDLYWTVCEVRWLSTTDGAGVSARVLPQAAWNGQDGAPREAPPTVAEIETLLEQATGPFTFFEPIAVFPGAARLEDLAGTGEEEIAVVAAPAVLSLCVPVESRYKVINVNNFATMRTEPGFDARVVEEIAKDQFVTPIANDDSATSIQSETCAASCIVAGIEAPTEGDTRAAEACRASNDVWWQVQSDAGNRGWMSARFLGTP